MDVIEQRSAADGGVAELFRTHRLAMVRLAMLLVDDLASAEDVVQDAYAQLHRRWSGLRDTEAAVGYLRSSVVNGCRTVLRRRRTARRFPHAGLAPHAPGSDERVIVDDEHRDVLAAIDRLPRRQREVIVLRYWSQLSEREIAEALGISVGSVKSNASRARAAVAQWMEERA